jgi:hypothetical protein
MSVASSEWVVVAVNMAMLTAAVVRCHPPMARPVCGGRCLVARTKNNDFPYVPWMIALRAIAFASTTNHVLDFNRNTLLLLVENLEIPRIRRSAQAALRSEKFRNFSLNTCNRTTKIQKEFDQKQRNKNRKNAYFRVPRIRVTGVWFPTKFVVKV